MGKDFKKQAAEMREGGRQAIPQVDPEGPLERPQEPAAAVLTKPEQPTAVEVPDQAAPLGPKITTVLTSEKVLGTSVSMYPSRHEQIVRDLAYIERRKPWEIVEDALEEYVVKHYGREHRRK